MKFTPEGGKVAVRAARAAGSVEISVSDTGIGIAHDDQEAIFEEFRQVGTDYARQREGTGLGLALSKRFAELHGGKLWVTSEVGRGSTFTDPEDLVTAEPVGDLALKGFTRDVEAFNLLEIRGRWCRGEDPRM